ncbi:MAG: hypothetical protein ACT4PT_07805 [Methanobacteriota archaeon]
MAATGPVTMVVSEDGSTLAAASLLVRERAGFLVVVDAATGSERFRKTYPYSLCCATPALAVEAEGRRVFAGGNALAILDGTTGTALGSFDLPRDGKTFPEVPVAVDIARGGSFGVAPTWQANHLVAIAADGRVLWDHAFADTEEFAQARVSADGKTVALAAARSGSLHDASTGAALFSYTYRGASDVLPAVAVSRDGSRFATTARVDDTVTLFMFDGGREEPVWTRGLGRGEFVNGLFMTPDGDLLAAWTPQVAVVLDAHGRVLHELPPGARIHAFVPAPPGALLLVEAGDRIEVIHAAEGFRVSHGTLPTPDHFRGAALTPDGVVVATTLWQGRNATGLRLAEYPLADIPWEDGAP